MSTIDPAFPFDLFQFVPKSVRDQDTTGILQRYLLGSQSAFERVHGLVLDLDTLHDVDAIADDWLDLLRWTVGWTSELDAIVDGLDAADLRKLIRLSVALWKLKGTELGLKDAIRVLTGRDVVIRNWFAYRWIVGVTGFWRLGMETDPFIVGNDEGDRDEYLSIVFVHNEVGVERDLLRKLAGLNRPLQEVTRIVYADLVDDFRIGRQKWITDAGTDVTWDDTRFRLQVPAGTTIRANVPALETPWEVVWRQRVAFTTASGGSFRMEFHRDSGTGDRYRATWTQAGVVTLEIVVGGVPTTLGTGTLSHVLPVDVTHVVGVDTARDCDGALRICLLVYEVAVVEVVAAEPDVLDPGQWRILNEGADPLEIDDVIAYGLPVTVDEVRGSGETVGDPDPIDAGPCLVDLDGTFSTLTGLWHASDFRYVTPPDALYYGAGESGYYTWGVFGSLGGVITTGSATSDPVDLSAYPPGEYTIALQWWHYVQFRLDPLKDVATVEILVAGVPVQTISKATAVGTGSGVFTLTAVKVVDISAAAAGQTIQVRFKFDSVDAPTVGSDGWFVDDVKLVIKAV